MEIWNLGGLSQQFWTVTGQPADTFGVITGGSALALGGWGLTKRKELKRIFSRKFSEIGSDLGDGERFDGLIFTVSNEELPKKTIDMASPRVIGLIATAESRASAEQIATYARAKGIEVLEVAEIADPNNPRFSRGAAKRLIKQIVQSGHADIAIDVTGGKTPMSIGAFMAAHEEGVATVYLKSEFDPQLKKPKPGSTRLISISAA